MSDLKFSCPKCGQHLSGDENWAGRQLQCPACQYPFIVPGLPPVSAHVVAAPVARPLGAAAPPPVPGQAAPRPFPQAPQAFPQARPQAPFSSLSLVAFILSILGIALPAVICGHIAMGHFKRQPGLRGRGLAIASLVIGYLTMAFVLLVIGLLVPALLRAKKMAQERSQPGYVVNGSPGFGPSSSGGPRPGGMVRSGGPSQVTPVTTNPQTVVIPSNPASGTVNGTPVTLAKGTLQNGILTLAQGDGSFSDYQVTLFLFPKEGEQMAGKKILVPEPGRMMNPHVHARFKEGGSGSNVHMVMSDYAMRLEFGQASGNTISGKIYLELPAEHKTKLSGTFQVRVER